MEYKRYLKKTIFENAIICIFLLNIDILILETLFVDILSLSQNEAPLKNVLTLQYVTRKHITSDDIRSNWR